MLTNIIDEKQYVLLGSRECNYLVGYRKDGSWYANADDGDYLLDYEPESVVALEEFDFPLDDSMKGTGEQEVYHLVELQDGRKQVAYWKTYKWSRGIFWNVDVFGEVRIDPARVVAPFTQ